MDNLIDFDDFKKRKREKEAEKEMREDLLEIQRKIYEINNYNPKK